MELLLGLVVCVAGYGFFKWHTTVRGLRFVRAFEFLQQRDHGASVEEANGLALKVMSRQSNPDTDHSIIAEATNYVNSGGKQLPVIKMARKDG